MANSINDFKSRLVGGGARPNLFQVIINFPSFSGGNSELASFMIKGASLPASTMGTIEVPYRGRKLKIAGDRAFENWSITVVNDTNMAIRNAFEAWMNGISNNSANTGRTLPSDYQTDLQVNQLDKSGGVIKSYFLRGANPVNISAIDLNYDTNDSIEEFTVEMAYQYWESNSTPSGGSGGSFGGFTGGSGGFGLGVSAGISIGGLKIGGSLGL